MPATVDWTKIWASSDDGSIFGGGDLGNIQTDIESHTHDASVDTFLSMVDTPSTYAGSGEKTVVNIGDSGNLEFVTTGAFQYSSGVYIKDLSEGVSTDTITSVGFTPLSIWFFSIAYGEPSASWGFESGPIGSTTHYKCIYNHTAGVADDFTAQNARSIYINYTGSAKQAFAFANNFVADNGGSFDVEWASSGTHTGTAYISWFAMG